MRHFLATFLLALCVGGPASAHAYLKQSDPAASSTLQAAPKQATITFTEELEPAFSKIQVTAADGSRVDANDAHILSGNAAIFSVGLKPLKPGIYTVVWHATSVDDHRTKGHYIFTISASVPPSVTSAWARPTPPGLTMAAAYLTITNASAVDDVLTGISTPIAAQAEMHVTESQNGASDMRPLASVPVKAGATVQFKPYGMHVMLTGLKAPLKVGGHFTLILHFAKAGDVIVTVAVAQMPPIKEDSTSGSDGGMAGMKM